MITSLSPIGRNFGLKTSLTASFKSSNLAAKSVVEDEPIRLEAPKVRRMPLSEAQKAAQKLEFDKAGIALSVYSKQLAKATNELTLDFSQNLRRFADIYTGVHANKDRYEDKLYKESVTIGDLTVMLKRKHSQRPPYSAKVVPYQVIEKNCAADESTIYDFSVGYIAKGAKKMPDGRFRCKTFDVFNKLGDKSKSSSPLRFANYIQSPISMQNLSIAPDGKSLSAEALVVYHHNPDGSITTKTLSNPKVTYLDNLRRTFKIEADYMLEAKRYQTGESQNLRFAKNYAEHHIQYYLNGAKADNYVEIYPNHKASAQINWLMASCGLNNYVEKFDIAKEIWHNSL